MTEPSPPVTPKPAATAVLMRDRPGGGPEVLLVQRHGASTFGPGAYVFPGGVLEQADQGPAAERLSPGITAAQAAARMPDAQSPAQALGFHVAALRETFEEALVLLAQPAGPAAEAAGPAAEAAVPDRPALEAARARMLAGELGFLDWLAGAGLVLVTRQMVYFAHWVTPEGLPLRFAARFFLIAVPQAVAVVPDGEEVLAHRWLTPAEAIEMKGQGAIHLMDPTVRNLELLGTFASTAEALDALGRRTVPTIRPQLRVNADGSRTLIYPWDDAYQPPHS